MELHQINENEMEQVAGGNSTPRNPAWYIDSFHFHYEEQKVFSDETGAWGSW